MLLIWRQWIGTLLKLWHWEAFAWLPVSVPLWQEVTVDNSAQYQHLTNMELISLLLQQEMDMQKQQAASEQQEAQLEKCEAELKKVKAQVRDLEDYIDNLLLRIMEQTPTLLQVRGRHKWPQHQTVCSVTGEVWLSRMQFPQTGLLMKIGSHCSRVSYSQTNAPRVIQVFSLLILPCWCYPTCMLVSISIWHGRKKKRLLCEKLQSGCKWLFYQCLLE